MPRALWTGTIAFSLVSVPIRLYPATRDADLHFHLVHEPDGSRIGYAKLCKDEDKVVPDDEIVRAFETDDGELVQMDADDFAAAEAERYRTIDVRDFVPYDQIDPILFEHTYYAGPDKGGEHVYALLARAMDEAGLAGIGTFVFHERERLGCLRVREGVITLEQMRFADEVRPLDGVGPGRQRVDRRELELAGELIERLTGDFKHGRYKDTYRERLCAVIERKRRGKPVKAPKERKREAPDDLLAALERSLSEASGKARKRRAPARSSSARRGRTTKARARTRK
jgi:DNA end-binding protein Ku